MVDCDFLKFDTHLHVTLQAKNIKMENYLSIYLSIYIYIYIFQKKTVSNLKCESVHIVSKTVLFIRAHPGKKEKVGLDSLANVSALVYTLFQNRPKKLKFAVTGKFLVLVTTDQCKRDYHKNGSE